MTLIHPLSSGVCIVREIRFLKVETCWGSLLVVLNGLSNVLERSAGFYVMREVIAEKQRCQSVARMFAQIALRGCHQS